ncbi:YjfB family protein [Alteribacillus sp. JSM 102045]|uniref:YjfB family protein n=1 Tax=Alteribacillus sp. JSM 102045 TaxID=1562101 RepID=UPI0035C08B22
MEIAAMSIAMSQGQVKQQAGMSVLKQAMDTGEQQGDFVNKMFDPSGTKAVQKRRNRIKVLLLIFPFKKVSSLLRLWGGLLKELGR